MNDFEMVHNGLHQIYQKHRRKYRGNGDSKQMCCMWSTNNPPDDIMETPPLTDIEKAFGITIDDEVAFDLYDMDLKEAAKKIMDIMTEQGQQ